MSESESFTSLSDLIDSHLSKPDIQASGSVNNISSTIQNALATSMSETKIVSSKPKFVIPGLKIKPNNESVSNVSSSPVSNCIKKKELESPQGELKKKVDNNEVNEDFIDLMKCMQIPYIPPPREVSLSPEIEDFVIELKDFESFEKPECEKKCKLSCLLDGFTQQPRKIRKCNKNVSNIGKVICMKFMELQEPYFEDIIETEIKLFDFATPSPDDIINATLKKPFPVQPRIFK